MKTEIETYQPEYWSIDKSDIYAARHAIENGIEYASELLADRDVAYGRDHPTSRRIAERMESDIAEMRRALEQLATAPENK